MLPAIEAYLSASTLAARTIALYRHYLNLYALGGVEDVDLAGARQFLSAHPGWSASTRHSAAAALRGFCRWRYGAAHPVVTGLRSRRVNPGPQRTLSIDQLSRLMASFSSSPAGVRNLALVTLAVDTGLRASELCALEVKHLHLEEGYLAVICKGGQWGFANFFEYSRSCLARWLAVRETCALPQTRTVFCSVKEGKPLSRDGLRVIFRRLGQVAGIGPLSPHDLRRTFATLASQAGAPDRVIQVAGRWSSIAMVQRYTQALQGKALQPWSPVNRVMGIKPEDCDP